MRKFWITTFSIAVTSITVASACIATVAHAEHPAGSSLNSVGRWLGYGWSRGYHTNDNRPPLMHDHTPPAYDFSSEFATSDTPELATPLQLQPAKPSVVVPRNNAQPGSQTLPPPVPAIKTPPLPFKSRSNTPTTPAAEETEQKGNMSRRVRTYFHRAERYPLHQVR